MVVFREDRREVDVRGDALLGVRYYSVAGVPARGVALRDHHDHQTFATASVLAICWTFILCAPIDKEELQNVVIEGEKQRRRRAPHRRKTGTIDRGIGITVFRSIRITRRSRWWCSSLAGRGSSGTRAGARCSGKRWPVVGCCGYSHYRNFPQGGASDMVVDISQAMRWVFENISFYGGDPDRIFLIAQSAGAHICTFLSRFSSALSLALSLLFHIPLSEGFTLWPMQVVRVRQAVRQHNQGAEAVASALLVQSVGDIAGISGEQTEGEEDDRFSRLHEGRCIMVGQRKLNRITKWPATRLKGFIGIAGPYNLMTLEDHFESRGLYKSVLRGIMEQDMLEHSPSAILHSMYKREEGETEKEEEQEWQ